MSILYGTSPYTHSSEVSASSVQCHGAVQRTSEFKLPQPRARAACSARCMFLSTLVQLVKVKGAERSGQERL